MRGFERYTHDSVGTLSMCPLTTWVKGKGVGKKVTFELNFEV